VSVVKLAFVTFSALVRNRLILLCVAVFVAIVLLMLSPLLTIKATTPSAEQAAESVLYLVSVVMSMVSGFGSLLAAWASADAVASEIRSGTILAVLARPVRRWQFLLAKFFGVQLLMAVYILLMFGLTLVLVRIGGVHLRTSVWPLMVYPMVRYAIYGSLAILLATFLHPILVFAAALLAALGAWMAGPESNAAWMPAWLKHGLYAVLPSTGLLSESNFLAITSSSLKQMSWLDHATALAYGLDYALVLFLLAAWSFRRRGLTRE
jgi:ABC-type transport system involved in multi-copper enzyme maturation permease subunit